MGRTLAQQVSFGDVTVSGPSGLKITTFTEFITEAIPYVFGIAGVGLLIMIILSGFTLMTSAGDAKKMEQGKNQLTYAIVGFIVIFAAFWIVQFAGYAFGIEGIDRIFGS